MKILTAVVLVPHLTIDPNYFRRGASVVDPSDRASYWRESFQQAGIHPPTLLDTFDKEWSVSLNQIQDGSLYQYLISTMSDYIDRTPLPDDWRMQLEGGLTLYAEGEEIYSAM
jgi:hypothetical protein